MEYCLVALLLDMSVNCLSLRGVHQFHLGRNQGPRLCRHLLKHPTDPSWTFLQVPNLQHQEETRAFLSIMAERHMAHSHQIFPSLDKKNEHPKKTHSPCLICFQQNLCQAGEGNQWETSPHGHHFHMVSPVCLHLSDTVIPRLCINCRAQWPLVYRQRYRVLSNNCM